MAKKDGAFSSLLILPEAFAAGGLGCCCAGGGVASNKIKGKAEFVNVSMDVKFEGKGVARALDPMLHNDKNTPPLPLVQPPAVAVPSDEKPVCFVCDKEY